MLYERDIGPLHRPSVSTSKPIATTAAATSAFPASQSQAIAFSEDGSLLSSSTATTQAALTAASSGVDEHGTLESSNTSCLVSCSSTSSHSPRQLPLGDGWLGHVRDAGRRVTR